LTWKARIQNLEATAARIRAFLDEAKTVEEALRQVMLQPVVATPVVEENGWSPAKTVREAWRTLLHLGQGVLDAAIWLVVVGGPIVLVVGTLALVAYDR